MVQDLVLNDKVVEDLASLSPVELHGKIWVKRDDLFKVAGVNGGKARTCFNLLRARSLGVVTAASRHSPQLAIVAHIAEALKLQCRVHTPMGPQTSQIIDAVGCGAQRIAHIAGYTSVIIARARTDAMMRGWTEIPFGMESPDAIETTAAQTINIPRDSRRIVVTVGSGMTLAGILHGIEQQKRAELPVLGVVVGADPIRRLNRWAPKNWPERVKLIRQPSRYDRPSSVNVWSGIVLDPFYEAKCLPYLRRGDCFWIVGIRNCLDIQSH